MATATEEACGSSWPVLGMTRQDEARKSAPCLGPAPDMALPWYKETWKKSVSPCSKGVGLKADAISVWQLILQHSSTGEGVVLMGAGAENLS